MDRDDSPSYYPPWCEVSRSASRRSGAERTLIHSLLITTIRLSQWGSADNTALLITVAQIPDYSGTCYSVSHLITPTATGLSQARHKTSGTLPGTNPRQSLLSYSQQGDHTRLLSTGARPSIWCFEIRGVLPQQTLLSLSVIKIRIRLGPLI